MAEVYLVLAEGPGGFSKLQVVKLMRSDISEHERPDFLSMFQDEARLAARLNHPNIVQSHEVGEDGGQPFIVMEYLDGQSLSRVQQRSRHLGSKFPLEMELFVLCQVLEGLAYAHTLRDYDGTPLNMVHRDVSPQNVFITYAGQTKLVDFGVAKTLESSKTRAGVVKGKVAYMAPEQVVGGQIDHRADLFSVGVLLWEAVAGKAMHGDLSVYESLSRLVRGDLPKIRDVVPDVPAELEQIVDTALALKPDDRFDDADAFRAALLGYLESCCHVRARDVGDRIAQLFARDRADVNEVIRRAMTNPTGPDLTPGDFRATRLLPDFVSSASPLRSDHVPDPNETRLSPTPRSSGTPGPALGSSPAPRRYRHWALPGAAGLITVAMMVLLVISFGSRDDKPAAASHATTTSAQPPIHLSVLAKPEGAEIQLDGHAVGKNPYDATHDRDERAHLLRVSAPGFRPQEATIHFDRDVALQFHLAPVDQPEVPQAERPVAAPTRKPTEHANERDRALHRTRANPSRPKESDPYVDLPPPRRPGRDVPKLDPSDPWPTDSR